MTKTILFIGEHTFPSQRASSIRIFEMARIVEGNGYNPIIIGRGEVKDNDYFNGKYYYEGIEYDSFKRLNFLGFSKYKKQYITMLDRYYALNTIDTIIVYASSTARFLGIIRKWASKKNIQIVLDVSENYSQKQFPKGYFDKNYWLFKYHFNYTLPTIKKVICCSTISQKHFESNGSKTVVVNALMNLEREDRTIKKDITRIAYVGEAGKKDKLLEVLVAIDNLDMNLKSAIKLILVGPTMSDVVKLVHNSIKDIESKSWLEVYGYLPREEALSKLKESHYSILLRPNESYANFGFPSKVAESMCLKIPVIATLTSDLNKYIVDSKTGFVIKDLEVKSIQYALKKACLVSDSEYEQMVNEAHELSYQFKTQYFIKKKEISYLLESTEGKG